MRKLAHLLILLLVAVAATAAAEATEDQGSDNMSRQATWDDGGEYRMGTDLAFWKDRAVLGRFDGLEIMDISDPDRPRHLGGIDCAGNQNDVSIWKHLAFVSVDSPMASDACDAGGASTGAVAAGSHWEGIRIFDVRRPNAITQIGSVYLDCGSHTHTLVPDLDHRDWATGRPDPRVLLYASSYPLGGQGSRCNAVSHRQISVIEVPLRDPDRARVVSTPDVSPAVGCHDITVFLPRKLALAACISESQVWDISDPARPVVLSHIRNPAMQIHHSSAWSWDGEVAVLGDEKGGAAAASGCQTGGNAPTGALWFYDLSDPLRPQVLSWYTPPQDVRDSTMCTAHNFNVVPTTNGQRLLAVSWYHAGTQVIDFTDAEKPEQVAWYRALDGVRNNPWSSYWYNGRIYANNFDAGYVPPVPQSRGFDVFAVDHPGLASARTLHHLNPQTQEAIPGLPAGAQGRPVDRATVEALRLRASTTPPASAPATGTPSQDQLPFCLL
ncbi:MAG: hypothetical protein KY457_07885 [Actinobacteria bacterium]|nr:hypothetical protein [Actinomycetota bacterium]